MRKLPHPNLPPRQILHPLRQQAATKILTTGQTITLSLRRVSLYDALVVVTLMADLEFEIDAQGIVNISKKEFTVP
jgi:hypothetical protein